MTALTHRAIARFDAGLPASPSWLRAALFLACLAAVAATAIAIEPAGFPHADPELARLLRGMAILKAAIVVAAIVLESWRFGLPIRPGVAVGYIAATVAMVVATVMIWQLVSLPAAAGLFHVGLFALAVIAWRGDRDVRGTLPFLR